LQGIFESLYCTLTLEIRSTTDLRQRLGNLANRKARVKSRE
jgi:hypothetical protein